MAAARAAEVPVDAKIELRRVSDGIEIRAAAEVLAPPAVVWETLTDYERLPYFIPGISRSVVLERRGSRVVLEQSGEARLLFFTFPIAVRLEVEESQPDRIVSRAVAGNLRRMNGRYDIQAGATSGTVQLVYSALLEPDFDLPPLIGMAALRGMVNAQFGAMLAEIRRRAALQSGK